MFAEKNDSKHSNSLPDSGKSDSTWQPISSAPRDGTRIRLGHEQEPSSMRKDAMFQTYGHWDGERWVLSAFFTIPGGRYGLLSEEPTHWLPDETGVRVSLPVGEGFGG